MKPLNAPSGKLSKASCTLSSMSFCTAPDYPTNISPLSWGQWEGWERNSFPHNIIQESQSNNLHILDMVEEDVETA